jgi:hypothetical protein
MELLHLRAHAGGFRGCALDEQSYFFFQCSRKHGVRRLIRYPREDFQDIAHFMAMMQKFISPPHFLHPTVEITELTMDALGRAYRQIKSRNA